MELWKHRISKNFPGLKGGGGPNQINAIRPGNNLGHMSQPFLATMCNVPGFIHHQGPLPSPPFFFSSYSTQVSHALSRPQTSYKVEDDLRLLLILLSAPPKWTAGISHYFLFQVSWAPNSGSILSIFFDF